MKHAAEYLCTMKRLEPLLRQGPKFRLWQFEMLCDWLSYFWNRGTISFVIDPDGVAQGVCLVKFFRRLEQFLEPFVHEPCGRFGMVELLAANSPIAISLMYDELFGRWGRQELVLWDRGERTEKGAPRMYRWEDYLKLKHRLSKDKKEIN